MLALVFGLTMIIVIGRLWQDLRRGGSLFHWSPPRWEHDEHLAEENGRDDESRERQSTKK